MLGVNCYAALMYLGTHCPETVTETLCSNRPANVYVSVKQVELKRWPPHFPAVL